MKIDRTLIKQNARQSMKTAVPNVLMVTMAYLFIIGIISYFYAELSGTNQMLQNFQAQPLIPPRTNVNPISSMLLSPALTIMTSVISAGWTYYTMNVTRGLPSGYGNLFDGFAVFGRVVACSFFVGLFTLLWASLAAIPFYFQALSFVREFFITGDISISDMGSPVLLVVSLCVVLVTVIIVTLRYSMSVYILLDNPEMSSLECISASKELMRGRKGELFVLQLSFFGWLILFGFPIGLAASFISDVFVLYIVEILCSLWITAYMALTVANFYNELITLRRRAMSGETDQLPEGGIGL